MMNYKKQKMVPVPPVKTERDPRSNTVSNGAFSVLAKPEQVSVRGTKRMRADKRKTAIVI